MLTGAVTLLMAPVIVAPIGLFALAAYFVLLTFAFITIFFRIGLFVRSFPAVKTFQSVLDKEFYGPPRQPQSLFADKYHGSTPEKILSVSQVADVASVSNKLTLPYNPARHDD
ncbi:MAG: hypothetical protein NMNS01_07680 [Nitrosomonas sp.]|nr:MAG: hypothetical protein NMNS01_07680 [Nitrosomonas sp.]